ncbi:hypothetical protein GIB67_027093, partial [Kingdonia uniflora]
SGFKIGIWLCRVIWNIQQTLAYEDGCSLIKDAFNTRVTFFDTSDRYGDDHDNELMIGKTEKQLPREQVQLSTKFGLARQSKSNSGVKGSPEYVRKCCEASLKHLDINYIDLYHQHRVDIIVSIEDTYGELKKLVQDGKIRYIGLSEASRQGHNKTSSRSSPYHRFTDGILSMV